MRRAHVFLLACSLFAADEKGVFPVPDWQPVAKAESAGFSSARLEALRAWMRLFVDYIATKQIIAPALNNIVGGPSRIYADSGAVLTGAIESLVQRAVASGDIRPDLDAMDLLRALVGVSNVASAPNWKSSARRLVDILILGSRQ